MPVYRRLKALGVLDHETFEQPIRELPNGGIQMYVRDPAGNIVELDYRDASTIPRDEVPEYRGSPTRVRRKARPQLATLWH